MPLESDLAEPTRTDAAAGITVALQRDNGIKGVYKSRASLCEAAERAAESVSSNFKQSVFLYYIARYLVSVYEARYLELPIQVWNEYRNALDHFMRHLSLEGKEQYNAQHLQRMEGHIQRAVLDVTKILCVKSHDAITQESDRWGHDVLDLIDGGNFRATIRHALQEATDLLEEAKANDAQLGHDSWINRAIIERFLDSFFKFDEIIRAFSDRHLALANSKRSLDTLNARADESRERIIEEIRAEIRPRALRRAIWIGLVTGLPMAVFSWWLGYKYPSPPPPVSSIDFAAPQRLNSFPKSEEHSPVNKMQEGGKTPPATLQATEKAESTGPAGNNTQK